MDTLGVKEFKDKVTQVINERHPVLVTKYNKPEGLYFPLSHLKKMPLDLKRQIYLALSKKVIEKLEAAGIQEEEVLSDFDRHRGHRR